MSDHASSSLLTATDYGDVFPTFTNWFGIDDDAKPESKPSDEYSGPINCAIGFDFMRQCLLNCLGNHRTAVCSALRHGHPPTRLIDTGPLDEAPRPKLVGPPSSSDAYVALSYCWGGIDSLKTTNDSLSRHKAGISFKSFPRTFQDAITIARQLQFRFLWIDCLCIIQDSREDWEREAEKMGNIYASASLTIAASMSENCEEGMFTTEADGCKPADCWRPVDRFNSLSYFIAHSSLAKRGWTLQERVLSRRVLHCAGYSCAWECGCGFLLLRRDRELVSCNVEMSNFGELESLRALVHSEPGRDAELADRRQVYNVWLKLVQGYLGHRRLTFPGDRLPALSGIAQRFLIQLYQDEYFAGIWSGDWRRGILFEQHDGTTAMDEPHCPSWSWARWNSDVVFPFADMVPVEDMHQAELIDHDIRLCGQNKLGEVALGSHLCLRAYLYPVSKIFKGPRSFNSVMLDANPRRREHALADLCKSSEQLEKVVLAYVGRFEVDDDDGISGLLVLHKCSNDTEIPVYSRIGLIQHDDMTDTIIDFSVWNQQKFYLV
jgi:hypothetical protein